MKQIAKRAVLAAATTFAFDRLADRRHCDGRVRDQSGRMRPERLSAGHVPPGRALLL